MLLGIAIFLSGFFLGGITILIPAIYCSRIFKN